MNIRYTCGLGKEFYDEPQDLDARGKAGSDSGDVEGRRIRGHDLHASSGQRNDSIIGHVPVIISRAISYNSENNKIYNVPYCDNDVAIIDGVSDSLMAIIPVGEWPVARAWNPVQNRTYVANYVDSTVSVIRDVQGIEERNSHFTKNSNLGAAIFNGSLRLPKGSTCRVFDISGRVVMPDRIRPGIYFIEIDGKIVQKAIKIR